MKTYNSYFYSKTQLLPNSTSIKAFSLIELIFVIVVIGIISSVAIPKLSNLKTFASSSVVKQDLNTIVSAIKSYYLINNEIEQIDDVVVVNPQIWSINPNNMLEIIHTKNGIDCIVISVVGNELSVVVDESSDDCDTLLKQDIRSYSLVLE